MSEQGSALRRYLKRKVVLKLAAKAGKAKLLVVGAAVVGGFLLFLVLLAALAGATPTSQSSGAMSCRASGGADSPPTRLVPIYAAAAQKYHLGPRGAGILAAINYVESDFGRSTLPGVHSGSNFAGAAGPMQFLYPSSWEPFGVDGDGDGDKDVYDPWDAIFAAANLLRTEGAPGDWYGAIFAYNHADWYVRKVERYAERFGGSIVCTPVAEQVLGGEAVLQKVETLYQPRVYKPLPQALWVGGGSPESLDSRLWLDAVWFLQTFHLRAVAARETGHQTHGDGTAMDLVPESGKGWDETARAAAEALGWRESCGYSGTAPVCPLAPAIQFVGYNGFPAHGDPAHIEPGAHPHLHVSWQSSSFGCGPGLCSPPDWVRVFPLAG
jgi:hypothetical protein